ncbi:MAG: Asp23/Gls24 family envelope stress response protein [Anaerolineales bacterium]
MSEESTTLGSIHISPNAVATIAYHAALQSYGVVGLAARNLAEGLTHSITREPTRGVNVRFDGEKLDIDVYVIVEYGTRVASVASSVANAVRYQVEKTVGLKVNEVNVHVQGLRVSNPD